jgi:hypothetical protein
MIGSFSQQANEMWDFAAGRGKPCGGSHISSDKTCRVSGGQDVEALVRAGKVRGVDPGAIDRVKAKKLDEARKEARYAVIHQKREVELLKRNRDEAEASGDKKAAAEARRKHIEAKKELKELKQKMEDAASAADDIRRYGREMNRYKASDSELQKVLDSGKLPAKTAEKVRIELAQRKASREYMAGRQS